MRIVVTGATGNAGSALVRAFRGSGVEVVGLARRLPETSGAPFDEADWVACDLLADDADRVLRSVLHGADAVVHLAWAVQPGRDDQPMRRANRVGTSRVLRAVAAAGVPHLVCCSSVAAYAPAGNRAVDERWPCEGIPGSNYSEDKVWLERTLAGFAPSGTSVAVVRPGTILQPAAAGEFGRWLLGPVLTRVLRRRWPVPLPFWAGLRGQVVHADDLAAAFRSIVDRRATGAFNIAAAPVLTAPDVAEAFGAVPLQLPKRVVTTAARASGRLGLHRLHPGWLAVADQVVLMDTRRARSTLDWRPRHDAIAALRSVVDGLVRGSGQATAPLAA
ncbi:NAD-dependent epimerase/dehydratase family protein [Labedaea rhizosphaerae]|uniref:Nucleoside-diphosphate-sugar epimerase n=1 Tax=Labedaea rhizosphaerae TaxID=598644 RepID=A0A4R6SIK7_LABRH|nr:NAD-dependent epimerase/dehydratase family protein [Labedaea rhizosphaerae]TDQ00818.1 nucleoside-diphosphate-sugar epimerase [Labedaea rhizosphaerae]